MGAGEPTLIPSSLCDDALSIAADDVQAFYITSNRPVVDYTSTRTREGNVVAENECVAVLIGKGKEYPFKKSHKKRIFNGQLDLLCDLPQGLSGISGETRYPFGPPGRGGGGGKKKKGGRGKKAKFMPRDGTSDAVCEDDDDCNDDLACIDDRCETRIGFIGGQVGLDECGLDGSPCVAGADCCSAYKCELIGSGSNHRRCKPLDS
uniref:Uncharacterized protein n=1 Tax=Minutocellus polymorphus TaxID=265543 RepID=A0A7S0AP72_9STRA|mmetsp:Transcript_18523/g.30735  ORF Transcript_18523/g.30735 Transcript_18523/m.30735 type:complete len:206 (+) Transcript_18523:3-620(+)